MKPAPLAPYAGPRSAGAVHAADRCPIQGSAFTWLYRTSAQNHGPQTLWPQRRTARPLHSCDRLVTSNLTFANRTRQSRAVDRCAVSPQMDVRWVRHSESNWRHLDHSLPGYEANSPGSRYPGLEMDDPSQDALDVFVGGRQGALDGWHEDERHLAARAAMDRSSRSLLTWSRADQTSCARGGRSVFRSYRQGSPSRDCGRLSHSARDGVTAICDHKSQHAIPLTVRF